MKRQRAETMACQSFSQAKVREFNKKRLPIVKHKCKYPTPTTMKSTAHPS